MTTPFYADEWVSLYLGDCLELADLWTCADVLVTDPPYGTQFSKENPRGGYGRRQDAAGRGSKHAPATPGMGAWIANDNGTEARDAALSSWGSRPAILFGSPRLPEPPGEWEDRLVWDKQRPGMNGGAFRYTHEAIYARGLVRANNSTFSILTAFPEQTDHIHAKPVRLMSVLLSTCPPGTIADPFAGSGSTGVAAKALGRKAILVELEERYCEVAAKRLLQDALDFGEPA